MMKHSNPMCMLLCQRSDMPGLCMTDAAMRSRLALPGWPGITPAAVVSNTVATHERIGPTYTYTCAN